MLWRLRFYWVVGACGGVLMALEILSSRILAPYFGNSVYVWGSIISVFLGALSLGYLWGGRLADRHPSLAALARLLALAAACQEALLLAGSRSAAALAGWTGASPAGTLLAAAALFGPASVLLATVSPYAVRLAARDLGRLGDTAGRLYALSTLGSLGGTLVATFLLIPFFELGPRGRCPWRLVRSGWRRRRRSSLSWCLPPPSRRSGRTRASAPSCSTSAPPPTRRWW
jgi:MFS family permease